MSNELMRSEEGRDLVRLSPGRIVLRRVRQGLYGLSALGVGAVAAAAMQTEASGAAMLVGLLGALLVGALGIILELVERWG